MYTKYYVTPIILYYFRFNIVTVLPCLLKHPKLLLNEVTSQGSTPLMVATKYASIDVLRVLLRDERVDVTKRDGAGRALSGLIGVASRDCTNETKLEIFEMIRAETNKRESLKRKKTSLIKGEAI